MTLGSLKEIVRRCDLMVTNDTGPRHIAAAFDVPVVTVFGPDAPGVDGDLLRQRAAGRGEGVLRAVPEEDLPAGPPLHDARHADDGLFEIVGSTAKRSEFRNQNPEFRSGNVMRWRGCILVVLLLCGVARADGSFAQVKQILVENCVKCHGGEKDEGGI